MVKRRCPPGATSRVLERSPLLWIFLSGILCSNQVSSLVDAAKCKGKGIRSKLNKTEHQSTITRGNTDTNTTGNTSHILQQIQSVRKPLPSQSVTRIVDRDAIAALGEQGIHPGDPRFDLHPPGHEADPNDYPFFAYWYRVGCGASVVHDDILLTAAHCLTHAPDDHHQFRRIELRNKHRGMDDGLIRTIVHAEIHPGFDDTFAGAPSYDFLILKLDKSVLVEEVTDGREDEHGNPLVEPTAVELVQLNRQNNRPSPGEELHAAGFGTVLPKGEDRTNSRVLMDVFLDTLPPKVCQKQYDGFVGRKKMKPDVMFCVGTEDGSRDTCHGMYIVLLGTLSHTGRYHFLITDLCFSNLANCTLGDSGGPVLDANNVQVGLVSWGGMVCADKDHAGVAARITTASVVPWIDEQICRFSATPPLACHATHDSNSSRAVSYDNRLPERFDNGDKKNKIPADVTVNATALFDIEVSVHHDLAPEETSWSLTHLDSYTQLYWQPYEKLAMPYVVSTRRFSNLVAGSYVFAISDLSGNGICCGYGPGFISITNPRTGDALWEHWGVFKDQVSVVLQLDETGATLSAEETDGWVNPIVMHPLYPLVDTTSAETKSNPSVRLRA